MKLDNSLAFFDIDSLEYRPEASERASILPKLSFRERVMPIATKLDWLYRRSLDGRHPLLFSVCCSGRVPEDRDVPEMLPIPAEDDDAWVTRIDGNRLFLVEKARQAANGSKFVEDMHDKFRLNANLEKFVGLLSPREWVVFGNGAAFCVHPVLSILMDAGQKLTILSDVMVDSAGGDEPQTPAALRCAMLDEMAVRGARVCSFKELQESLPQP